MTAKTRLVDAVKAVVNPVTGGISLSSGSESGIFVGGPSVKRTVTCVGDSLMAYGDNVNYGDGSAGFTSQSIVAWTSAAMNGPGLSLISNRAKAGSLIDGASANTVFGSGATPQLPSAITDNSDILWIHTGINHLNHSVDSSDPTSAQIITKIRRLLDICAPQKALVIIDSLCPINASASSPSGASSRRSEIPTVNAGIKALCANYGNVVYNDLYSVLATDNSGNANPSYVLATDGIHLTTYGAYVAGLKSAATIQLRAKHTPGFRCSKNVQLPDFSGTSGTKTAGSGTINGSVAANLALVIGSGSPVVTASVSDGKQLLTIDNSASGSTCSVQLKLNDAAAYLGTLANADIVSGFAKIECTSQTNMRRANPIFIQNPSGTPVYSYGLGKSTVENTGLTPTFPPSFSGIFLTPNLTISTVLASVNLAVTIEVDSGGSAVIALSGFGYNALTAV